MFMRISPSIGRLETHYILQNTEVMIGCNTRLNGKGCCKAPLRISLLVHLLKSEPPVALKQLPILLAFEMSVAKTVSIIFY